MYNGIKQQNKKKCNVTVWLIQCHVFENASNGTVMVYLRHFLKLPDIGFPCNLIKTTLNEHWSTFKLTAWLVLCRRKTESVCINEQQLSISGKRHNH